MTLGGVLAALRARWLVVLLALLLGVTAGGVWAIATPKAYVATATVMLRWVGPGAGVAEPDSLRYVTSRAKTYALLAEREAVLEDAIKRSGLDLKPNDLRNRIEAVAPTGSQVIRISARAGDPQEAAAIANATAGAVASGVAREEAAGPLNPGNLDALVAVDASPPRSSAAPRVSLYVAVGSAIGMVVGILTAIVLTYLAARKHPRAALDIPTSAAALARPLFKAHLMWTLLIAAVIPWRSDTFYEGGADPVVLAKAAISVAALPVSAWAFYGTSHRHPVPAAPVLMLFAYLAITVIGGLANEDASAAIVVAARVVILVVALCLAAAALGPMQLIRALVHVFGLLLILASVSGLAEFSGRLGGVLPPLNPNALAFVAAVVCVWLLAKVVAGTDATWELVAIAGCVVVVFLTGSRTGLAALVLAFVAMCFRITALRKRTFVLISLCLPALTYLIMGTDLVSSVLLRGGGAQVATLSNRTIAWQAAFNLDRDGWQTWFGQGLAQKKISVPGQYWETQLLDSSWISALVQGGILGMALVVLLGITTVAYAMFASRSLGAVWIGMAILTTLGGLLESGLFDGSLQFMVFFVTALGAFDSHIRLIALDRRAVTAVDTNAIRRVATPA